MKADFQVMLRHLHLVFDGCSEGMAEVAYGCPAPNKALLSRVDELDRLAGEALLQNGRGYNTYVGACVRHPQTAPFARAHSRDVICAPAVVVDLDLPGRAENAVELWEDMPPSFCVVTGMHPHKRMQMWWLLDQPITELELWTQLQRAMAAKYDGDKSVHDPARVMRLAGSIAQPVKQGRVQEPTFLESVSEPLARYTVEQIEAHCDAFMREPGVSEKMPGNSSDTTRTSRTDLNATENQALGLHALGKITDGREHYMRDTALACLRNFIGTHGCQPTPEELYELVWPQYEDHVVIDVPGKRHRGATEVMAMCRHTLARFERGDISSMRDLDAAITSERARNGEPLETFAATAPPKQQPAPIIITLRRPPGDTEPLPPRDWLYGYDYIRGYTSCTVAPGAAGKSSLLTVEALAMATGKSLLGVEPKQQLHVWMWNGEDPYDELHRRYRAAMHAYGLSDEDVGGRLFMESGRRMQLKLLNTVNRATQINATLIDALVAALQHEHIDVAILDPLVSIHSIGENDNVSMDALVKELDRISDQARIAIMLAHHSRKTNGNEVTTEDARGASALLAAVRSGRVINTMSQDEATRLGIKARRRYFRVENGKLNMAPPPEQADWFEIKNQPLGNGPLGIGGDNVGVVFQWRMPDVMEGFTGGDVDRALWELRSGMWLPNAQATQWAGIAVARVLGLDLASVQDKARVKMMLRRWEQSGALRRVQKVDPITRHARTFYEVNDGGD